MGLESPPKLTQNRKDTKIPATSKEIAGKYEKSERYTVNKIRKSGIIGILVVEGQDVIKHALGLYRRTVRINLGCLDIENPEPTRIFFTKQSP